MAKANQKAAGNPNAHKAVERAVEQNKKDKEARRNKRSC